MRHNGVSIGTRIVIDRMLINPPITVFVPNGGSAGLIWLWALMVLAPSTALSIYGNAINPRRSDGTWMNQMD